MLLARQCVRNCLLPGALQQPVDADGRASGKRRLRHMYIVVQSGEREGERERDRERERERERGIERERERGILYLKPVTNSYSCRG
jgi:hypothetical protein